MKGKEGITFRLILFALIGAIFFSCEEEDLNKSSDEDIRPLTAQEQYLVNSSNQLALQLLNENQTSGNFTVSPISTGMALGMIGNTGSDADFEEYKTRIGLSDLSKIELNKAFYEISHMLPHIDESVDIKFANSIWSKYELYENDDFYTKTLAYYNADIHEFRHDKEYDLSLVEKWIQTKSDFSLNTIEEFNTNANFQIINSSFFKGNYFNEIPTEIVKGNFTTSKGNTVPVNLNVFKDKKVLVSNSTNQMTVEMPLGKSKFVLNIVISENQEGVYQLNNEGDFVHYDHILVPNIISNYEFIPEKMFDQLKANQYLKDALKSNFTSSEIFRPETGFINKSYIAIKGLNGQNLSEIENQSFFNNPNNLVLNQSFYYFIKEKNSDLILFEGKFDSPL